MRTVLIFFVLFSGCAIEEVSDGEPIMHLVRYKWEVYGHPWIVDVQSNVDTHRFYGTWSGEHLKYEIAGDYFLRVIGYNPYDSIWVRASMFVDDVLVERKLSIGGHNVSAEVRYTIID